VKSHEASVQRTGVQRKGTRPITGFTPDFVTPGQIHAGFFSVPALRYTHAYIFI